MSTDLLLNSIRKGYLIMKMTMLNRFFFSLVLALMLMSGLVCAAAADEVRGEDRAELFSEGYLLPSGMSRYPRADMSDFNTYVLSELTTLSDLIDVSDYQLTLDDFRAAYRGLLNSHPELFYVSGSYSYYKNGNIITRIIPKYKYPTEEIPERVAAFNRELDKIISYANKASTTVGKLLLASDYLCVNYEYDEPAREIHSPEEMFEKGRGVCQAYTMIYVAVCNRLGVENTTAVSDAMNHIWNMVNIDGSWYHVDVTWNDPIYDMPYRAMHDNFLRSDAGIEEAGHYSWVSSVEATNTKYDSFFWQDIDHAVPVLGNLAYFTPNNNSAPDGRICTGNLSNGKVKDVLSYNANFYGSYYPNINPLWATSSTVYYGLQDTVYALPISGGKAVPVFSMDNKREYLFYFFLSGNTMYVTSMNMNTGTPSVHSFQIEASFEVTLDAERCDMKIGDNQTLTYTMEPEMEGEAAEWTSSNERVVTVSSNGLVTAVGPGVTTVTLRVGSATDACTVYVHSYDDGVEKQAPTCTNDGKAIFTCTVCGHTYTQTIPALGHSYIPVVTSPTCTGTGYTTFTCSGCGDSYTSDETPALGHSYNSGIETMAPTCTAEGVMTFTCLTCSDSFTKSIAALGHKEASLPSAAPTCTKPGLTEGLHCSICGTVFTAQEIIPALGHTEGNPEITVMPTVQTAGVRSVSCVTCGALLREESITITGSLYIPGDADDSGSVDMYDALLVLQYSAGWDVPPTLLNADISKDGVVDLYDAVLILQQYSGVSFESALRSLLKKADELSIDVMTILEHPQDQYAIEGEQAAFSVSVAGDHLQYQWYIDRRAGKGWEPISGAASDTYRISAAQLTDDSCQFRCEITDAAGQKVTSDAAALYVDPAVELPPTGDEAHLLLWAALMGISLSGIVILLMANKKRSFVR